MNFFSKKNKNFSTNQRGVSLIEISLVVAIIVILAAITIPIQNSVLTQQYLSDGSNSIQTALRTANLQAKLGSHNLNAGVW
ncbi:MAG: prepilin-type N-terminal cleavage/methylation domain-containing protein, partial [Candidatus Pacebacteria bacterium]|nr:prepilin-type N-terminal cleavage/methylation domain-containing protein [Candidatus Paceibacterota bacterium]